MRLPTSDASASRAYGNFSIVSTVDGDAPPEKYPCVLDEAPDACCLACVRLATSVVLLSTAKGNF